MLSDPDPDAGSTTDRAFFERHYETSADPWSFESDDYERFRYERLLDHVPPSRYRSAFEPGCSIGVLTEMLATRCETVTAIDLAGAAVRRARRRCEHLVGVRVEQGGLPGDLPDRPVDLVVFAEVGYYFDRDVLSGLVTALEGCVAVGGRLVAQHWTGESPDHVLHGTTVHDVLRRDLGLHHRLSAEYAWEPSGDGPGPGSPSTGFLLDVWDRT